MCFKVFKVVKLFQSVFVEVFSLLVNRINAKLNINWSIVFNITKVNIIILYKSNNTRVYKKYSWF